MPKPKNKTAEQANIGWWNFHRVFQKDEIEQMARASKAVNGLEYNDANRLAYMRIAREGLNEAPEYLKNQWQALYSTPFGFLCIGSIEERNGKQYFKNSIYSDFLSVFPNNVTKYLQVLFSNYQLPHPNMASALKDRYIAEGKKTKPFILLLKLLIKLYIHNGEANSYLTKNEILNFIQFEFFDLEDEDQISNCLNQIINNRATNPNPFEVQSINDDPYNRFVRQLSYANLFEFSTNRITLLDSQVNRVKELIAHTSYSYIHPNDSDWTNKFQKIMTPENYPIYKVRTIQPVSLLDVASKIKIASNDTSLISNVITALSMGKSIILYGPPGTGKTLLATQIADLFGCNSERVTATDDWSTYDTIGGLVHKGNEGFKGKDGVIVAAIENCYDAMESGKNGHWLVIDEINRCKIDAALGEMFTCLEPMNFAGLTPIQIDNKWNHYYTLNLSFRDETAKQKLPIPRTFRIIGTLNTYDKHFLHNISFALTRRFAYIYVPVLHDWNKEVNLIEQQVVSSIKDSFAEDISTTFTSYNTLIEILRSFVWHLRGYSGEVTNEPIVSQEKVIREIGTAQVIDTMKMCIGEIILYKIANQSDKIICLDNSICANIIPQLEGLGPKLDDDLIETIKKFGLPISANRLKQIKADNELF